MTFKMSAPSKTFLAGEYAVLGGGPALVLNTPPRFGFTARQTQTRTLRTQGIPEGSPADIWLRQRAPLVEGWDLEFTDPHAGRGGFGASGAQFLFVHTLTTRLQGGQIREADLLNDFRVCAKGSGSGADLLALLKGGVAHVDVGSARAEAHDWPYPDLGFAVLRTGAKIPTHAHLAALDRERLKDLQAPAENCARAFGRESAQEFCLRLREFAFVLRQLGLQAPRTLELLRAAEQHSWCLAAKGCGAFGADTILVLFNRVEAARVEAFAEQMALPLVAQTLSGGLEVVHETH